MDCRNGSNPNTSAKRRCGYTMHYMPAMVKVRGTGPHAARAVYLARGRNRAGNKYGEPWVPFAPGIR